MRIAIDARMLKPGSMHGIARYVFHLLKMLNHMGTQHEFFALVNSDSPLYDQKFENHIKLVEVKSTWISFGEQWELPRLLKKLNIDLFHAPSFVAPIVCPCDMVMTIHDLIHLVLPQFYTPLHQFYYQIFVRSCIEKSRYILTVSKFSKNEIIRTLQLSEDKVFVTYNGVSDEYRPVTDQETLDYVRDIYELPEKFILCVSNNKPHKNVHQLVRAFCYSEIDIPLVLACPVDRNVLKMAEMYGKKHLIYFSKFIQEEHLPSVYSLTSLFVYPSTYEGFGLPPLEALSCGAPVVVARSSSLPEVVGDLAIFANPFDYLDIARALDEGLARGRGSSQLQEATLRHIQQFSWEKMTQQTLEIYARCSVPREQNVVKLEESYESRH